MLNISIIPDPSLKPGEWYLATAEFKIKMSQIGAQWIAGLITMPEMEKRMREVCEQYYVLPNSAN